MFESVYTDPRQIPMQISIGSGHILLVLISGSVSEP